MACVALLPVHARAATITLSGYLDDTGNASLVGADLGAPLFGDDFEIANNVALYTLTVPVSGLVTFDSNGHAASGVDPYFTLFSGSGAAATFVESNFAQAFSTGGDFLISMILAPGTYQVALGAFANMSFAENLGLGTLGDGFIAIGEPALLGNYYYELAITTPDAAAVPEPSTLLLIGGGASVLASRRRQRRR
jgi:hypothetical protein